MNVYLAVDIGASGGRHIAGWLEDGRLQSVQAGIGADFTVIVFICWRLPAGPEGAQPLIHCIIIGEDRTAVTITAERLCREEGCSGNCAKGACLFPVNAAAKALGSVFQNHELIFFCNALNCRKVRREAEEVNREDHLRRQLRRIP